MISELKCGNIAGTYYKVYTKQGEKQMCTNGMCGTLCWIESVTGKFNVEELMQLQYTRVPKLIEVLKVSPPIVVLRALRELHGHKAFDKLRAVGADEKIAKMWRGAVLEELQDQDFFFQLQIFFNELPAEAVS